MASDSRKTTGEIRPEFNEVIHSPLRLQVCALLSGVEQMLFAEAQSALGVTDSHLSKNVRVLADAGLVGVQKIVDPTSGHSRYLTVLALTPTGRDAYRKHAAWLHQIMHGPDRSSSLPNTPLKGEAQ